MEPPADLEQITASKPPQGGASQSVPVAQPIPNAAPLPANSLCEPEEQKNFVLFIFIFNEYKYSLKIF